MNQKHLRFALTGSKQTQFVANMIFRTSLLLLLPALLHISWAQEKAEVPFDLVFTHEGLTKEQATMITRVEEAIERFVPGYSHGVDREGKQVVEKLEIDLRFEKFDGKGGVKAASKVTKLRPSTSRILPVGGWIKFDTEDFAIGSSLQLGALVHETLHIMGFGQLWGMSSLPIRNDDGHYTGAAVLKAYRAEFADPDAKFVPVEMDGGDGTAYTHWDESNEGKKDTGVVSIISGKDLRHEIMTGWLSEESFISNATLMALEDLGYQTRRFEGAVKPGESKEGLSPHLSDWFKAGKES